MSIPIPLSSKRPRIPAVPSDEASGSPDVSWLLHSNSYHNPRSSISPPSNIESDPIPSVSSQTEPSPQPPTNDTQAPAISRNEPEVASNKAEVNGADSTDPAAAAAPAATSSAAPPIPSQAPTIRSGNNKQATKRPLPVGRSSSNQSLDENLKPGPISKPVSSVKNQSGRRSSWISNLSSKFSSSNPSGTPRSSSVDSPPPTANAPPQVSSKPEFANPFGAAGASTNKNAKTGEKPVMVTHTAPVRRPSQTVLVHAGQERKDSHSGFLSSALRRLSSSGPGGLGKGSGNAPAIVPRKVMNIDQNRERSKIGDFDQNNLRRVAFVVDVEIAGMAGYADEEEEDEQSKIPIARRQSLNMLEQQVKIKHKNQAKDAKLKEKGEGAALKMPHAAAEEKDELGATNVDIAMAVEASKELAKEKEAEASNEESPPVPMTRKKEKKKRSEEERKARRERKRKLAEENGEIPLELSGCNDLDDDDSCESTPAGASTPVNPKPADHPTTDPLRIYKRCCQLRETTALKRVIDQISMPSSTLAEAPGTVAVLDLSGEQIPLADVVTLGDWLAVVPVRKLTLDDCELSDESVRVILAGLLGCKSVEQVKQNKKLPKRGSGQRGQEQMGVVEKISLKNNDRLTSFGWKHIGLFLHMCRSLKAIDLSGIPFPRPDADLSRSSTLTAGTSTTAAPTVTSKSSNLASIIARGLSQRFGEKLEELILSGCSLTPPDIGKFIDSALKCRLKRLGLANNNLTEEALEHIVRYLNSGICEGLDLGKNDMHGHLKQLAEAVNENSPFIALSLSQCNLDASDLSMILPHFAKLQNFRFIDLSHNQKLFSAQRNAVSVLRKYLPRLHSLKRIHLADVDMTSEHAIAIAEILPECSSLAHISLIENPRLTALMNSRDGAAQEEACALFASLMTAVRVSHTIIAIEIEIPSANSSEVVRALASQVVAYCLRNMEQDAFHEVGVQPANTLHSKDAPEVLLHLVGHIDGYPENHDVDEPAPDEDYVIASTGIVKALGVCLGTAEFSNSKTASRNITPTGSGTATPRQGHLRPHVQKKPRDMSKQLLDSARKIRMRLRPALVREDSVGNDLNYRRLQFLDSTLERIIQRFEDEYPETKLPDPTPAPKRTSESDEPLSGLTSLASSLADTSILSASTDSNGLGRVFSSQEALDEDVDQDGRNPLMRTSSGASLAARALANEEGRMHRLGQSVRRELLRPTGTLDFAHGTSTDDEPEAEHVQALRSHMERLRGDEIMEKVRKEGPDSVLAELNVDAHQLMLLAKEDPEEFQKFRQSQLAAQINAGNLEDESTGVRF